MNQIRLIITLAVLALIGASCSVEKDYVVTIKTEYGDMHAILYDETPQHKENFVKLAKEGFFDSTLFHRVIEDFMIQGGDPNSRNTQPGAPLGNGGPGYTIPAEFNEKFYHGKGALSAARQGDRVNPKKESSGSQFYIVQGKQWKREELTVDMNKLGQTAQQMMRYPKYDSLITLLRMSYENGGGEAYSKKLLECKDYITQEMEVEVDKPIKPERLEAYTTIGGAPHLDDEYTVFGQVIKGLEVIDKIAEVDTDGRDRPNENVVVIVSVEEIPKKKITKLYGYEFPEE